ncbi:MAG TPA: glutamine--fructose-6-phosphate transaminase (isomerizing), partial [Patescibacteria group bacterium]|nr:glutamine--fructose-6-phosphate transaminase (isomerizing) [Patescibacteria group bacterium]
MCGIFGYIGDRASAARIVFEGLKRLEYRGYDSWGVAVVSKSKIAVKKKTGKIGGANIDDLPQGKLAIGHTRWATHGGVTDINAHPHLDCSGNRAVIHNGIFENYEAFKKKLANAGHKFISETDTETVAHMLETSSFRSVFNRMDGLNAVIAIDTQVGQILAARNGSPLVIGFGKGENFLASDASALLPHTREVYFLEDNEMAILKKDNVTVLNIKTGKEIKPKIQKLNWTVLSGEKGKYPNFMLKEIYEQPKIISEIAQNYSLAVKTAREVKKARGTYFVGCGTAAYACLAGTYLFSKIAKRHINCAIGSEFGYHLDFLNKDSLVIPISQSGETMDILESVKKAKDRGAKIASIVNVLGSSLYRMSDRKILIGAGPEKAVASTKALTGMLSHLILLACALNGGGKEGQKLLTLAAKSTKKILNRSSIKTIIQLANKI